MIQRFPIISSKSGRSPDISLLIQVEQSPIVIDFTNVTISWFQGNHLYSHHCLNLVNDRQRCPILQVRPGFFCKIIYLISAERQQTYETMKQQDSVQYQLTVCRNRLQSRTRKLCSNACAIVNLYRACLERHRSMYSLASCEIGLPSKQISSSMILQRSSMHLILKGILAKSSSQVSTPILHTSTLLSQRSHCSTSGERQTGVPQRVFLIRGECTAHPKSHIFTIPSCSRMFSGLMSRWMISFECIQSKALQASFTVFATSFSLSPFPSLAFSIQKRFPPKHASSSKYTFCSSWQCPQMATICGCERQLWMVIYLVICSFI